MLKIAFIVFSIILFVYMVFPGPASIRDFSALPDSYKSTLSGDTVQVPNVAAYFSDHYRNFATSFYKSSYDTLNKIPFPSIKLNYPPEFAYTAIKDQTKSTYLEEYVYPLRSSLFVNGFEPLYENGKPKYEGAIRFEIGQQRFDTKVTLRFYYASLLARILVWLGITLSIYFLYKLSMEILSND